MDENLKTALDALSDKLEGKSKAEVKEAMDAFKEEYKEVLSLDLGNVKERLEKADGYEATIEELKEHLATLDVKLQDKKKTEASGGDALKALITANFEGISKVSKGKAVIIHEEKAVGNMTLGNNLTGDQPRDYSFTVAAVPGQMLNVADLIQTVVISGGTYTFPRESGSEGGIGTQTEGSNKSQIDYDITMVDVNTDFIAGYVTYSKKMANNLPFLESFLPQALRRDYWIEENDNFEAVIAAGVTASTQVITGKNKIEMLINEVATLEGNNFPTTAIVCTPSDYWDIMKTEKSTGAGYGLPGAVTVDAGQLRINGIPILRANWVPANKYIVGDWSRLKKVVTEGLSVEFSTEDGDNFKQNNITARVECQCALAIERTDALIYGDFTAT